MSETVKGLAKDKEGGDREGMTREILWVAEEILGIRAGETSEAEEEYPNEAEITEAREGGRETAQGILSDREDFRRGLVAVFYKIIF